RSHQKPPIKMRVCHYKTRLRGFRQGPPPDRSSGPVDRFSRRSLLVRMASLASSCYLAPALPESRALVAREIAMKLLYAPDVVGVDRLFLIALEVPPDAPEVTVSAPESVKLFDRTPIAAKTAVHRFYFR